MTRKAAASSPGWDDDDLPEWTDDQLDRAELAVAGKVVRPANGTLTRAGRPPLGSAAKQQVTLRLDPDVLERFRATGPGWQGRINEALRRVAEMPY
ncbi:BrnA antitoxin family protein [Sphingomonas sp. 1P08PE]|uniref:BrnA antitoxin family protein n=1 Tax=Sphingomonas sp. 1P08PE TaxID=554122 RepID=UPI0039A188C9